MSAELLEQAIALSQAGKQQEACELLVQVITDDVYNETAWLWLARALPTREDTIGALERCLNFNPACAEASNLLAALKTAETTPPAESDTKQCFFCAENIKAEAKICRYCGRDVVQGVIRQPQVCAQPAPESKRGNETENHLERSLARQKSYVGPAVLCIVLYLFFYLPGLIANVMFYSESRKMEKRAGESLPGTGCLVFMLVAQAIGVMFVCLIFGVPLLAGL